MNKGLDGRRMRKSGGGGWEVEMVRKADNEEE